MLAQGGAGRGRPIDVLSYADLRRRAFSAPAESEACQLSEDMAALYRFWPHFLRRRFDHGMHDDFRQSALADLARQPPIFFGTQQLVTFYRTAISEGLSVPGINLQNEVRDALRLLSEATGSSGS